MPNSLSKQSAIDLIHQAKARCKKALGQHFLQSDKVIEKIVSEIPENSFVLEIGPGAGVLSWPLAQKAKKLILIEKDCSLKNHLESLFQEKNNVHILWDDALTIDLSFTNESEKIYIVSNLPYNVGTAILIRLLKEVPSKKEMILMFQKEVADRIISSSNKKSYGSLSIFCQISSHIDKITDVKPGSFLPPPEVNSTVLHFKDHDQNRLEKTEIEHLELILQKAFQKRRKMLRQSLKSVLNPLEDKLEGIAESSARPENLNIQQWIALAKRL